MNTDWIVIDSVKQEMRCNRCGDTHPLSSINGARLDVAAEFLRGFERVHAGCGEMAA